MGPPPMPPAPPPPPSPPRKYKFKFKIGDRVVYTSRVYGDVNSNPLYGGRYGMVGGKIYQLGTSSDSIHVKWDNNCMNSYRNGDLEAEKGAKERMDKRDKAEKKMLEKSVVKINAWVFNTLCAERKRFRKTMRKGNYPWQYILGKDENGEIKDMLRLEPRFKDGCQNMTSIHGGIMAKAMQELIKRGCTICGIARVGLFDVKNDFERGVSLQQLQRSAPDMYVFSFGVNAEFTIDRLHRGHKLALLYGIVKARHRVRKMVTIDDNGLVDVLGREKLAN